MSSTHLTKDGSWFSLLGTIHVTHAQLSAFKVGKRILIEPYKLLQGFNKMIVSNLDDEILFEAQKNNLGFK